MYKKLILWYVIAGLGAMPLSGSGFGAEKADDRGVEVRKLLLSPAAEPVPAMAYRLMPRQLDKKTGNAALLYATAAALCPDGEPDEVGEKINEWRAMAAEELPRREVDKVLSSFSTSFHHVELAAYRTDCSWEMPLEDGFSMQLPNLSGLRRIAKAMRLEIRLKIADGQTDEAIEMLQHAMQMSRNIAEGPTLVQDLVGVAIAAMSLFEVEGLMQRPDLPSLYWALTALPDPMIDMYSSLEYERESLFIEFPQLRGLEDKVLTPAQASAIVSAFMKKMQTLIGPGGDVPFEGILPLGWVMMHYSDAKQFLAGRGFPQRRIEEMPAAQAVLIYQKQEYLEMRDSLFKWFALPYHQSRPRLDEAEKLISRYHRKGLKDNLFRVLIPALYRVAFIEARLDRHIALLRTVEAIRMFAADHSGRLPASLGEITSVPVPSDPVTGEAFIYRRTDARNARLEAPVSPSESRRRPVYELTLRR
jgi:hypothetical protein